ncbi:MAG TPA: shikimate kinase [Alphaproteobacteria bacterium]|nr:shikimate kinase [Alphaproteobacteria bacterium]
MNSPSSSSFVANRTVVLTGMMGAGKSSVGRKLAARLAVPFVDSDHEIEAAAGMSVSRFFETYGEDEFRKGERRVIARLLDGPVCVLSTGGGAFIDPDTRALIKKKGVSIWLKVDVALLVERATRRDDRPLLRGGDPREIMEKILAERSPIYAEADLTIESDNRPVEETVDHVMRSVSEFTRAKAS